jgi:hypothetical protein
MLWGIQMETTRLPSTWAGMTCWLATCWPAGRGLPERWFGGSSSTIAHLSSRPWGLADDLAWLNVAAPAVTRQSRNDLVHGVGTTHGPSRPESPGKCASSN